MAALRSIQRDLFYKLIVKRIFGEVLLKNTCEEILFLVNMLVLDQQFNQKLMQNKRVKQLKFRNNGTKKTHLKELLLQSALVSK